GTCSLHLVLRSMGVGPGDEVITAPNSFFASAAAISLVGATIVFADVNEDSNLDPDAIEAAVTDRTRAIMPVHLTGRPVDMVRIQAVADAHGLGILEDAAQAVGSSFRGQRVGSWGTAASFSLHPLKSLHAFGDAGIVTARDERIISDVALRKNHGLVDRGTCAEWSFNCRLDEVQAALLRVQLRNVDAKIAERRRLAHRYHDLLRDYVVVPEEREGEVHTYQTYLIQAGDRDALQAHLRANGVEAIVHYATPLHLQPAAVDLGYGPGSFPVTERLSDSILSLPLFPGMTVEQQDRVVAEIAAFYDARDGAGS
ncbi:MAG: Aminotransferase class V-fold PLP-dependent enzyme, partial [Actinomycetota bacterium]|nr:Aminotransferase class V-fold PLP-dependent enzyme [Actinomycetota bacterium]